MVAAVNALLRFLGREDCRVKALRLQRRVFREQSRELTREEYDRLIAAAQNKQNKIASGEIFITRSGKGLTRRQIWAEMKALCDKAGVERTKVFPHNLWHLFARIFYKVTRDIAKLSDVLGHSSMETTRIYLISTGAEHARTMDRLGLVS